MAINKKLIHFRTKTAFTTELNAGNILDTSIVFIKDTKEIWTHGQLYSCSLTEEEVISIIENSQSISDLTNALNNKVDKVEGKQLSTNDYTTAEKNKLAEALDESAANILINTAIGKLTKASVGLGDVDNTSDANKPVSTAQKKAIDDAKGEVQGNLNTHTARTDNPHSVTKEQIDLGNVTNDSQVKRSEMGVPNGVAVLDENGLISSDSLPSSVNNVIEFDSKDSFPTTGESGKIYVAKDSNRTYRWSENQYTELSVSLALGETSTTAYAGDKGKDVSDKLAKVRSTQLSHIKDTDTFSVTAEKVSLNYDCYVGDQYGAEATSHSVDIPVASETQAGIVTAEDKKAITNLDTTYAKKADVDKSIKDLSDSINAGGTSAVISLTENSSTAYAKSYVLKQGDREVGTINIPKDMVVSSGSLQSVTVEDTPYAGAKVGDKYIDLIIANSTNEHIYIPVSELVNAYIAGNGLALDGSTFYAKKDATSEDYLTISKDGIKISGIDRALEGKVNKEEGKSLVLTTEITKLENLPDKASLEKSISDAKKAGDNAQSSLDAHIGDTQNPHNVNKSQVGLGNVTNDSQVKRSEMGTANGVATLDDQGLIPASQLPSYVDDVIDVYATYTKSDTGILTDIEVFSDSGKTEPITGESGKIYIDVENNYQFRWTGTQYAPVGAPTVIGEVAGTAYDGSKGKAIADKINEHVAKTDNPHNVTKAQIGLDNVDNTSDKLKPISDATQLALNEKVDKVAGKSLTSNDFTDTLKNKLDGIAANANNYSLPTASETELGGVMVDSALNSTSTNPVQNRVVGSAIEEINGKLSWAKIN